MDVNNQIVTKTYEGHDLSYFDLIQSLSCAQVGSTPLSGDASIALDVADFGPLLIAKRSNSRATLEDMGFGKHTLVFQLPMAEHDAISSFLELPGGEHYNPFQCIGAKFQWLIPQDTPLYHIQVDVRWLTKVLGRQAIKDYKELCKAPSRKAYDESVLFTASVAAQHALDVGKESVSAQIPLSASHLERLATDIVLPCIMSDLKDVKASTRHKILNKALEYITVNYTKPIRLEDLANSVATSVRNVQMIFKQELGISPSDFIRQFRLHRFRHHLADANSVTEAAHVSGFKHLGRLTEHYSKTFNKYPSEDLLIQSDFNLDLGADFE